MICCGTGYNGGDGFCAAWHLAHRGYAVQTILAGRLATLHNEPAVYANILKAFGVPCVEFSKDGQADLSRDFARSPIIVDGLLGIGIHGDVRPLHERLIGMMNASRRPVVSVDVPSGLDADTGRPQGSAVRACMTVTFTALKPGLTRPAARPYTGRLIVADIGIPRALLMNSRLPR
jgi:NAD(P)H-hydrate epimerase